MSFIENDDYQKYMQKYMRPYYDRKKIHEFPYSSERDYYEEIVDERDMDRIIQMYPDTAKRIQKYVNNECDKMEYDGSIMYDEYPDRVMMRKISTNILNKLENEGIIENTVLKSELDYTDEEDDEKTIEIKSMQKKFDRVCHNHLCELIEVMLFNEIYKRRCKRRHCKRWW